MLFTVHIGRGVELNVNTVQMRQIIKVHQRQFYLHDSSMFTNQLAFEQVTPGDHYLVASQTTFGATNAQTTGSDNIVPTSTY